MSESGSGFKVGSAFIDVTIRNSTSSGLGNVKKDVEETTKKASSGFGKLKGVISPLAGVVAGAFAVDKVKDFFGSSIEEARESQKVNAQTAAVIKSTGGAAKLTAAQFGNLATAISNKTGIDDETIQSGENMLATFTNIRNAAGKNNDIFTQSTKIMTDMSVATGVDMKSSAIQLGKALNDPTKGITALTRVGVTFTDQQKKQIADFQKHGQMAKAQGVILKELNKEFGGSASAQATAGEKMKTVWKNFQEQIGTMLLPVIDKLETFISQKVLPALTTLANWIQAHVVPVIKEMASWIKQNISWFGPLVAAVTAIIAAVKIWTVVQTLLNTTLLGNPIVLIVLALAALVTGVVLAYQKVAWFRDLVNGAFSIIKTIINGFISFFTTMIPNAFHTFVNVIQSVWATVWNFLKTWGPLALLALAPFIAIPLLIFQHWSQIEAFLVSIWNTVKNAIMIAINAIKMVIMAGLGFIKAIWMAEWNFAKNLILAVWSFIRAVVQREVNGIRAIINILGSVVRSVFSGIRTAISWIGSAFSSAYNSVSGWIGRIISTVTGLPGRILALAGRMLNAGKSLANSFFSGINSLVGKIGSGLTNAFRSALNNIIIGPIDAAIGFINHKLIDTANDIPFVNIPHIPTIPRLATGGWVAGPGSGTSDSIPAMLSNGEFVVNAKSAAANAGLLSAINNGATYKRALGSAGVGSVSVDAPVVQVYVTLDGQVIDARVDTRLAKTARATTLIGGKTR